MHRCASCLCNLAASFPPRSCQLALILLAPLLTPQHPVTLLAIKGKYHTARQQTARRQAAESHTPACSHPPAASLPPRPVKGTRNRCIHQANISSHAAANADPVDLPTQEPCRRMATRNDIENRWFGGAPGVSGAPLNDSHGHAAYPRCVAKSCRQRGGSSSGGSHKGDAT